MEEAQRIIQNVSSLADNVCVNKNQCKRVAERFDEMGKALDSAMASLEESAMVQILLVLKKGETLVSDYKEPANALRNVLNRALNYAAFKEIHEQIDDLGTYLYLPAQPENHLDGAAATDRQLMKKNLDDVLKLDDLKLDGAAQVNVRNVEKVVYDKCSEDSKDDLSYLRIPFSEIELGRPIKALPPTLNKGDAHLDGQALVYEGRWNGCDCAIKVFMSSALHWNTEELQKEVASLVKLRHPHITQLIGCAQNQEKTYVLYEKMDGDLRDLMKKRRKKTPFSPAEEVSIITQIAHGMFYLHEQGYVHGELKCTNLLVKQVGGNIDVKVSDFHCSKELGQQNLAKLYKPTHRVRWLPPEAFDHYNVEQPADEVLKQGDVYSFAMTCYEVVTGGYPFDGISDHKAIKEKILEGEMPTLPAHLNKSNLKNIIQKCWATKPEARPSFKEIRYLLQVIDITRAPSILACLPFGNTRVADEPEIESEWDFKNEMRSGTYDVAKDLPHYLQIDPANLKPIRRLGTGASAEVFAASWVGCKFAVKWLISDHVSKLQHEVGIMMKLLHPHVVRLVGFSVMARANRCAIVMELMEKSLRDFMKEKMKASPKRKPFSEAEAVQIITKLALGMNFLHSRGVAHGDLKCANVMVRNVEAKNNLVVKLVDFGLSHLESRIESKPKLVNGVGQWRAPEVIASMESKQPVSYESKPADVYSFGMMCLEIITGKDPYDGMSSSLAKELSKAGSPPNLDSINVGKALKDLLKACWCVEPLNRPTFPIICACLACPDSISTDPLHWGRA